MRTRPIATNVAVVCEYPTMLGGERSILSLAPRLLAAGITLTALAPVGKLAQAWQAAACEVVTWSAGRFAVGRAFDRRQAEADLAATLASLKPQLVHANSLAMGRLVGPVARRLRIPSIAHLRDIVRLSAAAAGDLNLNTRLIAVSDAVRRFHAAQGVDAAKTHVLHNGVDLNEFRPGRRSGWLRKQLGLPPETQLVGGIGQISLRKGWDVLLASAAEVLNRHADAAFVLVGGIHSDKPETRRVEQRLTEMVKASAGRIYSFGERDDVPRILPELDLLAHAARQEPLGRVLLEAAACGLAIVATDVGGTREIFPPEASAAVLVPPDDSTALAAAIMTLLSDRQRREALGAAARRRAEQAFDADAAAAGLLRHYREVAAIRS